MSDKKFTATEIINQSLTWAEESISNMIEGHTDADGSVTDAEHVAYLKNLRKQMRAYRWRRFGHQPDPMAGAKLVDAMTTKFKRDK